MDTDPERLRIALVNMLVNARHAVNGSQTGVTLHTRLSGDRVRIVIEDRGAGIEARDLAHVFDPYFTTKRGGTGLGLPIAKNIVEGLGGAISVASSPGHGTEIVIDLPFDSATSAALAQGRPFDSASPTPAQGKPFGAGQRR